MPPLRSCPTRGRACRSHEVSYDSGLVPWPIASANVRESSELNRVSLVGAWEPAYWTHRLDVSAGELMRIIGKVGNSVTAVRKELGFVTTEKSGPT